jgi:hypothetical protein
VREEGRIREKQRWLKPSKKKEFRTLLKNQPENTTTAATPSRRKPSNQLYVHSLSVREEMRVREKHKWLKLWKEKECRRPTGAVGEGRKKTKSRGEEKLLNPFLKLLKT